MKKLVLAIAVALTLTSCTADSLYSNNYNDNSYESSVQSSSRNYVANRNSKKLHSIHCNSLPYEENRIYFSTIEEANQAGYTDQHKECMG